jgi:LemA protein
MEYNTKLETFPNNMFVGIFNFKAEELFEIQEKEKEVPKVEF